MRDSFGHHLGAGFKSSTPVKVVPHQNLWALGYQHFVGAEVMNLDGASQMVGALAPPHK